MEAAVYILLLLQFFIALGNVHGDCDSALGMENRNIPDSDITASSKYSENHAATNARLNNQGGGDKNSAWSAQTSDKNQWIQINLHDLTRVTKVATQGRKEYNQYVTQFKISYSLDGENFIFQDKVYTGNEDQNSVVLNTLIEPIEARYIRIHPQAWYGHISLRLELFGCKVNSVLDCSSSLGMENGQIPDSDITASSEYSDNHAATNARLNNQGGGGKNSAWSAQTSDKNQWIQVNLHDLTRVTKVATQGRKEYNQYVTQFKISYSLDGENFIFQDQTYTGNDDQNTVVYNTLVEPIEARYIRIHPQAWYGHISLRMELFGCKVESECDLPLGMENGKITNSDITASSEYSENHAATNARLNNQGDGSKNSAWSAQTSDKNQWIQVNLHDLTRVTKIATQGRKEYNQYVTQFKISYSLDGENFIFQDKIFTGNDDQNTVVSNTLPEPIEARFIRLHPYAWYGHISLRMELYGCSLKPDSNDGYYSEWGPWSQCSVTCGFGSRSRRRTCTNPPPGPGGEDCSRLGPNGVYEDCIGDSCPVCGHRMAISSRIVNGQNAWPNSWPWQISLRKNGQHYCGGSLIKPTWVLTAAHCIERFASPSSYTVVVGAHERTGTTDVQQSLNVKRIIVHPDYNPATLDIDIAILELEKAPTMSKKVNLVCLPPKGTKAEPGKRCYITGWGKTIGEDNYSAADVLQQAILPVVSQSQCNEANSFIKPVHESTMICAGSGKADQAGGCHGDSGGPFVCEEDGKWVLRGAVSWGDSQCRTEIYTVFARVSNFLDWISDHVDEQ